MQILHLDSSIFGENSVSRILTEAIVAKISAQNSSAKVVYRDLASEPIAHLDGAIAAGFRDLNLEVNENEKILSRELVSEFLDSSVIVVGAPMYNFSVPTQLKAWIDRIVQPGRTFQYTPSGPIGLAGEKQVFVASTRGGAYSEGRMEAMDFQEKYLTATFKFLGIHNVQFIRAESLSRGPDQRTQSIEQALSSINNTFRILD